MSEQKNPKVKVEGKFDGLLQGLQQFANALAKVGKLGRSNQRQAQLRLRRKKRRRQGKVARRARRYNRRPSKRPKGKRKP